MKKTIAKTKLVLSQETMRTLSAGDLHRVGGGVGGYIKPCSAGNSGCMNTMSIDDQCVSGIC